MEKMIIANLKMNMNLSETKEFITKLKKSDLNPIICPTSIYATYFIENGFQTGLQNIYFEDKGAYTGEISPVQARNLGIEYVIIGHSERRELFNETNEIVNKKIKKALEHHLKVILCIGEREDQRNNYQEVLNEQIAKSINGITEEIIISYEPVWAIGTGNIPSNDEIAEIVKYIKSLFNYDVKVLYGGSVNSINIKTLNEVNEVNGYLIGGAATNADELLKMGEVVR